jgi:tetratricopeptide (TPR) repeat protein
VRRKAFLCVARFAALLVPAAVLAQPLSPSDIQRANQHYRNGWDRLRAEAFEEAVGEFQKTIEIDDRYAHAYYGLGKSHMALKQYLQAIAAYERCRNLYEQATSERTNAQYAAYDRRRDQLMILQDTLRSYRSMPPNQQQSSSSQNAIRELQEQIRQLEAEQQRGLVVDPVMRIPPFVSLALGSAYFRSNRMADAEKLYREAIAAKPDYGEAHNNLAVICLLSGRLDEADEHVKLAEKANFNVPQGLKADIEDAKRKASS